MKHCKTMHGFKITVMSSVPQGPVLAQGQFNVFINGIDSRTDCTLSKFADDTKLCGASDMPDIRDAIQRDLDTLEKQAYWNLMRFNRAKCKVYYLGRENPKHEYRLGSESFERRFVKNDLGVLVDEKWDISQ
ncbi:rna-directed dna polymerase from mobile element jockey-like [Willisornis vidua]|uniref:Rna-directed dna polymerase from mobile element jockey-like n=1 Tax=Willisornis vidua TaxID=1566151 RepID=A0ABQ9DNI3_9PASS|nr:rna-directed dna polymerase from mobile element jockey-like [Willisornis vidua]